MNPLIIIIIVLLLFGGGGFYFGGPAIGASGIGLIVLIAIAAYFFRGRTFSTLKRSC